MPWAMHSQAGSRDLSKLRPVGGGTKCAHLAASVGSDGPVFGGHRMFRPPPPLVASPPPPSCSATATIAGWLPNGTGAGAGISSGGGQVVSSSGSTPGNFSCIAAQNAWRHPCRNDAVTAVSTPPPPFPCSWVPPCVVAYITF